MSLTYFGHSRLFDRVDDKWATKMSIKYTNLVNFFIFIIKSSKFYHKVKTWKKHGKEKFLDALSDNLRDMLKEEFSSNIKVEYTIRPFTENPIFKIFFAIKDEKNVTHLNIIKFEL